MQPHAANINIDDRVLIGRCRSGDISAMERLIIKYQNRIFNVILKICGNNDDAAELTQETFVKVIESLGKFREKSSFYTWVFRIAVNLTLTYCKRNVKLGFRSLEAEEKDDQGEARGQLKRILIDEDSPDPALMAQNAELCELAVRAMMKLEDEQRTVLVLRDIEGMQYAEISDVLGVELGTVKSRLSRARGNLREIMETLAR